jgi:hypothetical protein
LNDVAVKGHVDDRTVTFCHVISIGTAAAVSTKTM